MSDGWHGKEFCVLCAAGDHDRSVHNTDALVITTIPNRKGKYLAIQSGSVVKTVARFSSEEDADLFLKWIRERDGRRFRFTEDGETTP